jgi:hypothetical protein
MISLHLKLVRVPVFLVLDLLLHNHVNVGRCRGGVGSSRSPGSISGSSSRPVAVAVYQYNSCLNGRCDEICEYLF